MFQSGFTANVGHRGRDPAKEDVIVSDQLNHASIIDGARLSRAEIKVFPHKDVDAADGLLAETGGPAGASCLITDGVFSMDGDIAPLPDLVEVAERHGAIMMIDDAHASGVLGDGAPGTVDHFGLHGRVDIQVGTLSKAFGVLGGFIAGPPHLIEWLENRGPAVPVLHVSAPPAVAAACLAALDVIARRARASASACGRTPRLFKEGCARSGSTRGRRETPITPVIAGDEETHADVGRSAVRRRRVLPRDRVPHGRPGRRGCGRS